MKKFFICFIFILVGCQSDKISTVTKQASSQAINTCEISFSKINACSSLAWNKSPTTNTLGNIALKFHSKDGTPSKISDTYDVQVYLQNNTTNAKNLYPVQKYFDPDFFTSDSLDLRQVGNYLMQVVVLNKSGIVVDIGTKNITMTSNGIKSFCPYDYVALQMCADIQWDQTPQISRQNSMTIKTWKYSSTFNGPYSSPAQKMRIVIHNISRDEQEYSTEITHNEEGVYHINNMALNASGNYEVYVQFVFENELLADQVKINLIL